MTPASPHGSPFKRYWRSFLRARAGLLVVALLVSVIEGSTLGALSWMLEPLFDEVFAERSTAALVWVGAGILGLFVIRAITAVISKTLMSRVHHETTGAMQSRLLEHILTLDGSFFQKHSPGLLIDRVVGDTSAAQGGIQAVLTGVARDVVALVGLFVVALSIDATWTAAALVGTPLLLLPMLGVQRYIRRKTETTREEAGQRVIRLDEIFHGISQVKLNRMEAYQSSRFAGILRRIIRAEVKSATGRATMPAMVDIVTGLGFFAVLMLGGREVAEGSRTTGEFMSFFTAMALTFQPIRRLSDIAGQWQIARTSLERVYAVLDTQSAMARPAESRARPQARPPSIVFDNVTFGYGDNPVLRGLSFTAEAGKVTALVGASGAGKSTVFHLLTGLADPQTGAIHIDGVDTREMTTFDQRGLFAAVTQDAALFDETLRENLVLGRDGLSEAALDHALRDASVAEFLQRLEGGLETRVGPRGSALSGGQRQRVAIARALLADAPVLLLDEATSALDTASETAVTAALARAQSGRTTLVIAHRLSTVRDADRIVVLDAGQVAEEGTHEALLAAGGAYARLHALQFRD